MCASAVWRRVHWGVREISVGSAQQGGAMQRLTRLLQAQFVRVRLGFRQENADSGKFRKIWRFHINPFVLTNIYIYGIYGINSDTEKKFSTSKSNKVRLYEKEI